MLPSSATLTLVAELYKKEITDYATAVGDALTKLLDAAQVKYLSPREVDDVKAFVASRFTDKPPNVSTRR